MNFTSYLKEYDDGDYDYTSIETDVHDDIVRHRAFFVKFKEHKTKNHSSTVHSRGGDDFVDIYFTDLNRDELRYLSDNSSKFEKLLVSDLKKVRDFKGLKIDAGVTNKGVRVTLEK
jgi:hypothetical protein